MANILGIFEMAFAGGGNRTYEKFALANAIARLARIGEFGDVKAQKKLLALFGPTASNS